MSPMHLRDGMLSIGELSRQTGVTVETIRYYERRGMFPSPSRTNGGQRLYDSSHIGVLLFVRRSRELEFTLQRIKALLDVGGPDAQCAKVHEIAVKHLDELRAKLTGVIRVEGLLTGAVECCTGSEASRCPVLDYLAARNDAASKGVTA